MNHYSQILADEEGTRRFGAGLAPLLPSRCVVYLEGNLGAGKTTLVRALLHAAGHQGAVRSPTYTLVEPYQLGGRSYVHMDLYRLADPEELEFLGLRDLLDEDCVLLAEWPERGRGVLPAADVLIRFEPAGGGRHVEVEAFSPAGEAVVEGLKRAGI